MKDDRRRIAALCPLFVCRLCRTKTGWAHQGWCAAADSISPDCADCLYRAANGSCAHPTEKRKERRAI